MSQSIEMLSVEVCYDSGREPTGEPITIGITDDQGREVASVTCSPERAEQLAESLRQSADVAKRVRKGVEGEA